jgi:UDP-2,3-diacylglucosamine hydrolase
MIYFLSDHHLGLGDREHDKRREQTLLHFLSLIKPHCTRLFVLGDLFDYWFEYTTVVPKYHIRTLAALAAFVDAGIPVDYLIGNHDFGHRTFFQNELGITIHKGDLDITLHNKRFYLAHGDGKAFNDTGYLILRSILRNPLALWAWKWLHPDIGVGIAAYFSRKSRMANNTAANGKKFNNERDGLEFFAEQKITQGWDYVLMGHLHKPVMKKFLGDKHDGVYINTGDWLGEPATATFASFDGVELRLWYLEEFLRNQPIL